MKNVTKILKYENKNLVKNHVTMIKRKYNQNIKLERWYIK